MFGRKKEAPPVPKKATGKGNALMAQMGIMDADDMEALGSIGVDDDDDDDDLEAELRALQEEDEPSAGSRQRIKPKAVKGGVKAVANLDRMIAESMKEVASDEDVSDTEAPDLLAELEGMSVESEPEDDPPQPPVKQSKGLPPPVAVRSSAQKATDSNAGRLSGPPINESVIPQRSYQYPVPNVNNPYLPSVQQPAPSLVSSVVISSSRSPASAATAAASTSASNYPVFEPTSSGTIPSTSSAAAFPKLSSTVPVVTRPAPAAPGIAVSSTPVAVLPPGLSPEDAEKYRMLAARRDQYKMAAVAAKRSGDDATAKNYIRTSKQFDSVLQALEEGKPIDLSKMPPPPPSAAASSSASQLSSNSKVIERSQGNGANAATSPLTTVSAENEEPLPELTQEDRKKLFNAPEKASTVMEALQQRLTKYKEAEAQAKQEENSSKMKRQARIVKQYEDAIKLYKAGKPVDFEELPCPPGFPPIPVNTGAGGGAGGHGEPPSKSTPSESALEVRQQNMRTIAPSATNTAQQSSPNSVSPPKPVQPQKPALQKQVSVVRSRAEQQATFLEERQAQFKASAMQAKSSGDLELAKKYLRMAKGFDQMIEASRSGLPVDLSQIPAPPGAGTEAGFEFVDPSDCSAAAGGSAGKSGGERADVYKRLQEELVSQIKTSESNRDHFTKLGDVSSASKFDKMCQNARKDLEALKNAYEHGDPVPRFHYEATHFSIVQSCTELGDNDLEIIVIRGLNYNLPAGFAAADLNTFVKYEFPFPDTPQVGETATIKGSTCPEYNQTFKLEVNRKSRAFLRLLKSNKVLRLDVYYKRGFLKGDKLLGTVSIKLQPLEDKCIYHDSYDLMENRKAVGGKLEVKLRIREPFVTKQVEEVKEKWLIIDEFERKLPPQPVPPARKDTAKPKPVAGPAVSGLTPFSQSISVLQFEKQQLDAQIEKYTGKLKPSELDSLKQKGAQMDRQVADIKDRLHKGGAAAYRAYVDAMTQLHAQYAEEAKSVAASQGSKEKLQNILTKRKLVEKEIETLRAKLRPS